MFLKLLKPMKNVQVIGDVSYAARVRRHLWPSRKRKDKTIEIMLVTLPEWNCIIPAGFPVGADDCNTPKIA